MGLLIMKLELSSPAILLGDDTIYNVVVVTAHALIMVFLGDQGVW